MRISYYEQLGFQGVDVSLEISLKEYGLIWKTYKRKTKHCAKGETLFIFGTHWNDKEQEWTQTDNTWLTDYSDIDWIDIDKIADFTGQTKEELLKPDNFPWLVYDCVNYYGAVNFGIDQ